MSVVDTGRTRCRTAGLFHAVQQQGQREQLHNEPRFLKLKQMKPRHFRTVTRISCLQRIHRAATLVLFVQYVVVRNVLEVYRLIATGLVQTCVRRVAGAIPDHASTLAQHDCAARLSRPTAANGARNRHRRDKCRCGGRGATRQRFGQSIADPRVQFPGRPATFNLACPHRRGPTSRGGTRPGRPAGGQRAAATAPQTGGEPLAAAPHPRGTRPRHQHPRY